jgi:cell pole-organizing protein PopZ
VQEKSLCENHGVPLPAFKTIIKALDKDCDVAAGRIKSQLQEMNSSGAPSKLRTRPSTSPQKSPSKSAMKAKSQDVAPAKPLTLKRVVVAFSHTIDDLDDTLLPETPTKRRRVESPLKLGANVSPIKRTIAPQSATPSTAAFDQAIRRDSTPHHEQQKSDFSVAISNGSYSPLPGPSTPRCTRNHPSRLSGESAAMEVDEQRAEPPVRKRFRPVFLDQQQWCSRDPRLAKIWDAAIEHRTQMMELYTHPFEQYRPVVTS